ncbi:hemin uptake protein HemP [Rhizobium sp. BK347]|nr:hemin uptake protein HemP [Rhizobium sp. BK252]MBB3402527.1 hemin uptake protein HemP [Rhizobium sp. BK289]MBB3415103.1 hemin uptake protein HemP [Rhizobium sp. BK284]MBB3482992.1 hemin uptake protein HemP [Rhizobium sp. BK347]
MNFQAKLNRMIAEKPPTPPVQCMAAPQVRIVESTDIFRGQTEIMIRHEGVIYRMKITRQGKLILNK